MHRRASAEFAVYNGRARWVGEDQQREDASRNSEMRSQEQVLTGYEHKSSDPEMNCSVER